MRKHNHGTKLVLAILCAGSLMTAMTSGANPLRRQLERGTIQNIDPQQSTLTVRDARDGSSHSYSWNQDTKFLQQLRRFTRSKAIGVTDLQPGEQVNVFYKHEGDRWLAQKIVVTGNSQTSTDHKGSAETQT